jgi:hypothetical protein
VSSDCSEHEASSVLKCTARLELRMPGKCKTLIATISVAALPLAARIDPGGICTSTPSDAWPWYFFRGARGGRSHGFLEAVRLK